MPYSSLSDAQSKLLNVYNDHSSSILYGTNNRLDSTTIFYTNAGLTTLAPAGNYVIPTNYKSYYVTLDSFGKITGSPQEIMSTGIDQDFVADHIYNITQTNPAVVAAGGWLTMPNTGGIGGTNYQLTYSGSNVLLTDNYWDSRPYSSPYVKARAIEGASVTTESITNLNVTEMRGYDFRIISGEWNDIDPTYNGNPSNPRFTYSRQVSAYVHLAPDPNRVSVTGSLIYYFKPDYWLPTPTHEGPTYFRRMPDVLPIYDSRGVKKTFVDMAPPVGDLMYPASYPPDTTSRILRTSTRRNKGITETQQLFYKTWALYEGFITESYSPDRFVFDGDSFIYDALIIAYGTKGDFSQIFQERATAIMESLVVDDDTWANGYSPRGIKYSECNPRHYTYIPDSGTGDYSSNPANTFRRYFDKNSYGGAHVELDFEYFGFAGAESSRMAEAMVAIYNQAVIWFNNTGQIDNGGVIPYFSNYAGGVYNTGKYGSVGAGWFYVPTGSNATTTEIYSWYHDYYTNGTKLVNNPNIPYSSNNLSIGQQFYMYAAQIYDRFYISNYLNEVSSKWYWHSVVHNYDISRKILVDTLGSVEANKKKVMLYCWRYMEPIEDADFNFERKANYYNNDNIGFGGTMQRPALPPSMFHNLGVWAFGYAEGIHMWEFGFSGEQKGMTEYWYNYYGWDGTEGNLNGGALFSYGDTNGIDKGSLDWLYVGYFLILQNKDIVGANTPWLKPEIYHKGSWLTGTANYPVTLYNNNAPISAYKLSADGTEALLLITDPFNSGIEKKTFKIRLPNKDNQEFDVSVWGHYASVIRIRNL
jgi:hypothetical protein